jgi:hypothetical protein
MQAALEAKDSDEVKRLEVALNDLYEIRRSPSALLGYNAVTRTVGGIEYDPTKPFLAQALRLISPEIAQSLPSAAEVSEQLIQERDASVIEAETFRH